MKGSAVFLTEPQCRIALAGIVEKLLEKDVEAIAASVDAVHYHVLARFQDGNVRRPMGLAKKNASILLTPHGLPGTVWAKKCRPLPIDDRRHQLNVFDYILAHKEEGAWVWSFRDGYLPPKNRPAPPHRPP